MARNKSDDSPQKKAEVAKQKRTPGDIPIARNLFLKISLDRGVINRAYYFRKKKRGKEYEPKVADASVDIRKVLLCRDAMSNAVIHGRCPIKARDEFFGEAVTAQFKTFGQLANELMESLSGHLAKRTVDDYRGVLKNYVLKYLNHRIAKEIDTADIVAVMNQPYTNKYGITGPAYLTMGRSPSKRLLQIMDKVLNYGNDQEKWEKLSVARWKHHMDIKLRVDVSSDLYTPEKPNAALPFHRVPEFMQELRRIQTPGALLLEFICLTGLRGVEARLAEWKEFDFDNGIWHIPAKRMKKRRPHGVLLTPQMIAFLKAIPRRKMSPGQTDYVFCGKARGKPIGRAAAWKVIQDMHEVKLKRDGIGWTDPNQANATITVHGFRASMRTWGATKDALAYELVNAMQARRGNQSSSDAQYFRATDVPQIRQLWIDWGDYILPNRLRIVA